MNFIQVLWWTLYRSCDELTNVFSIIFSDSEIGEGFQLSKAKTMYLATYAIALHFKYMLKENISKSDVMTFSFDESLNRIRQNCEMDVIVHYSSEKKQKVKVKILGSSFFGHAKHQNILNSLII